jgi:hypothetical protein
MVNKIKKFKKNKKNKEKKILIILKKLIDSYYNFLLIQIKFFFFLRESLPSHE